MLIEENGLLWDYKVTLLFSELYLKILLGYFLLPTPG